MHTIIVLFNLHGEQIMRTAGLEDTGIGVKIGGKVINNLRYADDTTNDLELLVIKVRYASAEVGLELKQSWKRQIFKINGQDLEVVEC